MAFLWVILVEELVFFIEVVAGWHTPCMATQTPSTATYANMHTVARSQNDWMSVSIIISVVIEMLHRMCCNRFRCLSCFRENKIESKMEITILNEKKNFLVCKYWNKNKCIKFVCELSRSHQSILSSLTRTIGIGHNIHKYWIGAGKTTLIELYELVRPMNQGR